MYFFKISSQLFNNISHFFIFLYLLSIYFQFKKIDFWSWFFNYFYAIFKIISHNFLKNIYQLQHYLSPESQKGLPFYQFIEEWHSHEHSKKEHKQKLKILRYIHFIWVQVFFWFYQDILMSFLRHISEFHKEYL
jgi:hypothetical protein